MKKKVFFTVSFFSFFFFFQKKKEREKNKLKHVVFLQGKKTSVTLTLPSKTPF